MNMFSPTSGAGDQPELIPDNTLHFAQVRFKEIRKSQNTGGSYASLELALIDGPHEGRKVWTIVMNPMDPLNENKEKKVDAAKMGIVNISRMLEAARIVDGEKPDSYNILDGKSFEDILGMLDGQKVAIKIKVRPAKDGYDAKNEVGEYLSPFKGSGGYRGWQALVGGLNPVAQSRNNALTNPAPAASKPTGSAPVPTWLKKPGM